MEKPTKLNFRDCTLPMLDRLFQLEEVFESSTLDAWLKQSNVMITEFETQNLEKLQYLLSLNVKHWNESELLQNFIAPLFVLADFSTNKQFSLFAERRFGGIVDEVMLAGQPDGMIASGFREPEKPYFCFQEYKRETDPEGDPAGQCLAAMLVAQEINQHQIPIYGCYVIGELWRFVVLQERIYSTSIALTASGEGIYHIFRTLKTLKQIIINHQRIVG
ncbi:hypothetical protein QUF64_00550 [Anaerolineales bacterium HSG6]|nr:hypothetical protein [Anaerolineales bacterium HSG6]MDM8529961.1 hypothetical protein [Anaerolineales bacterium HSG25]